VERGLKSESRIGPKAYLSPGGAFAGGTLARDIRFLIGLGERHGIGVPLCEGVRASNNLHKDWTRRHLARLLGDVPQPTAAGLGLTYKPGTTTLRRSAAVELCSWLLSRGVRVQAHDPAVHELPGDLGQHVALTERAEDALQGADVAVVATEWPEFRKLGADA